MTVPPIENLTVTVAPTWPPIADNPDVVNQIAASFDPQAGGLYLAFGHGALAYPPGQNPPTNAEGHVDLPIQLRASLFLTPSVLAQLKVVIDQQLQALGHPVMNQDTPH